MSWVSVYKYLACEIDTLVAFGLKIDFKLIEYKCFFILFLILRKKILLTLFSYPSIIIFFLFFYYLR